MGVWGGVGVRRVVEGEMVWVGDGVRVEMRSWKCCAGQEELARGRSKRRREKDSIVFIYSLLIFGWRAP